MADQLKSPYVYFGGKSKVAKTVWERFGKVKTYIEPFFGSGAVFFANPDWQDTVETVNDLNHYIANFWRAVIAEPERVAEFADYPVIETDLHARHVWLVNEGREIIKRCEYDPEFFDAKVAGWWVWGMALWIGGGFCDGTGAWNYETLKAAGELGTYDAKEIRRQLPHLGTAGQGVKRQLPHLRDAGQGIKRQLPHLGDAGQGVKRQLPHLRNAGQGIKRQLPHLGDAGQGVTRKRPHLRNAGQGIKRQLPHLGNAGWGVARQRPHLRDAGQGVTRQHEAGLSHYITELSNRFRRVRVCCGDWERITKPAVTWAGENGSKQSICGVFLDPPYSQEANRDMSCYGIFDDGDIAHAVRAWCIANGGNKLMRIALCGYQGEHDELEQLGWTPHYWKAGVGYSAFSSQEQSKLNREREVVWFSPHCNQKSISPEFDFESGERTIGEVYTRTK
jgi:hypothetical protein